MEDKPKPKYAEKLDKKETKELQAIMTIHIVKVITSYPKTAEAAAAALASLIHCAYELAKRMWGIDDALKAIKTVIEFEAQKDKENQS